MPKTNLFKMLGGLLLVLLPLSVLSLRAQSSEFAIQFGETRSAFFEVDAPVHEWTFPAAARETIIADVQRIAGQGQPRLRLLDSSGGVLAESVPGTYADTATLTFDAGFPSDGEYRIEVSADGLYINPTENPDEYSLTLTRLGQRHASRDVDIDPLPEFDTRLPEFQNGEPAITSPLNLTVYGGAVLERPDARGQPNYYTLTRGLQQIEIQNANPGPVASGISAIGFIDSGIGLLLSNSRLEFASFFTDQNFEISYDTTNATYTFELASGQTIITDFFRIPVLIARNGLVVAQMEYVDADGSTQTRLAVLSGSLVDLRRRRSQAANETPILEIRLENDQFVFTDLSAWDTLAYVNEELRVLYGDDGRIITRPVQIPALQTSRATPGFYDIQLASASGLTSITLDWQNMGDIRADGDTLAIMPLDGRTITEPLATTGSVMIEQRAMRFERVNQPERFRLVLPDGTDIETAINEAPDTTALPHEPGFIPRGYNNLSDRPFALCPCINAIESAGAVNPVNGNFYYRVTDFSVQAPRLALDFTRHYNSQAVRPVPSYLANQPHLGTGWRHTYQVELDIANAPLGNVTLLLPDGGEHQFSAASPADTRFTSRTLLSWIVEREASLLGAWRAISPDGVVYAFDRAGRLQRIIDAPAGDIVLSQAPLEYSDSGGVFVIDPYGRRLEIYVDASGRIQRIRDTLLRDISYSYDPSGIYLTGVQYIDPALTATYQYSTSDMLARFDDVRSPYTRQGALSYDERGRVSTYTTAPDSSLPDSRRYEYEPGTTRAYRAVSAFERLTTWTYDDRYLVTSLTLPQPDVSYTFSYDENGLPDNFRTPTRSTYQMVFDANGNLTQLNDPFYTSISDGYSFTYAQQGNHILLTKVEYPGDGEETFIYDTSREDVYPLLVAHRQNVQILPTRITQETRYEYDERGRIVLQIEPGPDDADTGTVYVYDTSGYPMEIWQGIAITEGETRADLTVERAQQVVKLDYDIVGNLRSFTDGRGNQITLSYDPGTDRIVQLTAPQGVAVTYSYDGRGNITSVDDRGQISQYTYDDSDRVISQTDAAGVVTAYSYDEAGNVLSITDGAGRMFTYRYDLLDNPIEAIAPEGLRTVYETRYDVTANRMERRETLPSGRTITRRFDALSRLRQYTIVEDSFQQEYLLDYDAAGRLAAITENFSGRTINYTYNLIGQLKELTIAGQKATYEYDRAGNLAKLTSPGKRVTSFLYDHAGNVIEVTQPDGAKLTYDYDAANNLAQFTDGGGFATRYTYDSLNQLTGQLNPDGDLWQYSYDGRGNLAALIDPAGSEQAYTYDLLDRLTSFVDASGAESLYEYNSLGQPVNVTQPAGRSTRYGYDLTGNLIATTVSPLQRRTLYSYDIAGRLTGVTNPLGQTTSYTYNGFGRVRSIIDPVGNAQQFEWRSGTLALAAYIDTAGQRFTFSTDDMGRITAVRDATADSQTAFNSRFSYDPDGYLTEIVSGTAVFPDNIKQRYIYNSNGRIVGYVDPLNGLWSLAYDAAGNLSELTAPDGVITRYSYNGSGQITQVIHQAGTDAQAVEAYDYNPAGDIIRYTSPGGIINTYAYDGEHRLIEAVLASGTPDEQAYTFQYNGQGQVIQSEDPLGRQMRYIYSLDNLARVEQTINDIDIQYRYEYDDAGNLSRIVLPDVDGIPAALTLSYDAPGRLVRFVDGTGSIRAYTYDSAGNLIQISDPTGSTTRYEYDRYNRVTRLVQPDSAEINFSYDPNGNLSGVTLPPNANGDRQTLIYEVDVAGRLLVVRQGDRVLRRYEYDASGDVASRTDGSGVTTCYRYDAAGRVIESIYRNPNSLCDGDAGAIRYRVRYSYDDSGNLLKVERDNEEAVTFTYDALNRIKTMQRGDLILTYAYDAAGNIIERSGGVYGTLRYTYDERNRPVKIEYGDDSVTLSYDARGNMRELIRSNGVRSLYNYDAVGRVGRILHLNANDERLDGFNYQYDAEGNLIAVDRVTDNWRMLYSYDVAHRLIGERWLNQNGEAVYTLSVSYDNAGNRVEIVRNGATTRYTYNARNQLISEQRADLTLDYAYDEAGNLISMTCGQNAATPCAVAFSYDEENRILSVVGTDETGERIDTRLSYDTTSSYLTAWRSVPAGRFNVYVDHATLIALRSTTPGAEFTETYFSLSPHERLMTAMPDGTRIWALNDASGSPRRFVDGDGNLLDAPNYQFEYNSGGNRIFPYSDNRPPEGSDIVLLMPQFAGQLFDPSTDLYLTGLRACDPTILRFLQPDPVFQDTEGTLYTCARNRPFTFFDPHGATAEPFVEPTEVLPQLALVHPDTLVKRPELPGIPLPPSTASRQQDEFFRAWQLADTARYSINDTVAVMSPLLNDFYIAGLNPVPESVKALLARPMRDVMALYEPGSGWIPNPAPDPRVPRDPFAGLRDIEPLIAEIYARPGLFCPPEPTAPWTPHIPVVPPPAPIPSAWQAENRLQDQLPPVSLVDAFAPEIRLLANLPSQFASPLLPSTVVPLPEARSQPITLPELKALREQQQHFLERILNFADLPDLTP